MLGVICAMDIEAEGLIALMQDKKKVNVIGYNFTVGSINDKDVVVVLSGVGKANAAAVTALLISSFNVTEVINLGVCGGNIKVGTMIVADSVVQYDFDTTAIGDELGQLGGFDSPYIKCTPQMTALIGGEARGVIASGDKFINDENSAKFLAEHFNAIGFDMESGAVAQICTKASVKFAIVRVVSDGVDITEYEKFKVLAAQKGVNAVVKYLGNC